MTSESNDLKERKHTYFELKRHSHHSKYYRNHMRLVLHACNTSV